MQDNQQLGMPSTGMNRDLNPMVMQEKEYAFALNANMAGFSGDFSQIQNEPSNLLCKKFGEYRVCGLRKDPVADIIYFFLSNIVDGTSMLVMLNSTKYVSSVEDIQVGDGLDIVRELAEPLESSAFRNTEICEEFLPLIYDDVKNPCIGFSVKYPVYDILIKDEQCGKTLYWSQENMPPRYLNLKLLAEGYYGYKGQIVCGDESEKENVLINCDKLRIFPLLKTPVITAESIQYGGSLRAGRYQFAIALCDSLGNELSNYSVLTNSVPIFDSNAITVREGHWGSNSGYGIRLEVSNIDEQVGYYKVAVIQTTVGLNGEQEYTEAYYDIGVKPSYETTVYYTSDRNSSFKATTLQHIFHRRPLYNTARGMTSSGNQLYMYGMTVENEWNLQPMCNIMGHFLHWQTGRATEDLYKTGINSSKYLSFMRDEVYPFGIRFYTDKGYRTKIFNLVPPPKSTDAGSSMMENKTDDILSIEDNVESCSDFKRTEKWQYYSTAKHTHTVVSAECKHIIEIKESRGVDVHDFHISKNGVITLDVDSQISNISRYITENLDTICSDSTITKPSDLCSVFSKDPGTLSWINSLISGSLPSELPSNPWVPTFEYPAFPNNCKDANGNYMDFTRDPDADVIYIPSGGIVGPDVTYLYTPVADYTRLDSNFLNFGSVGAENKRAILIGGDTDTSMFDVNEDDDVVDGVDESLNCSASLLVKQLLTKFNVLGTFPCTVGCSRRETLDDPYLDILKSGAALFLTRGLSNKAFYSNQNWRWNTSQYRYGFPTSNCSSAYKKHKSSGNYLRAMLWQKIFGSPKEGEVMWANIGETATYHPNENDNCGTSVPTQTRPTQSEYKNSYYNNLLQPAFNTGVGGDRVISAREGFSEEYGSDGSVGMFCCTTMNVEWRPNELLSNARWVKINRPKSWTYENSPLRSGKSNSDEFLILEAFGSTEADTTSVEDNTVSSQVRLTFWSDTAGTKWRNLFDANNQANSSANMVGTIKRYTEDNRVRLTYESFLPNPNLAPNQTTNVELNYIYVTVDTSLMAYGWSMVAKQCISAHYGINFATTVVPSSYAVGLRTPLVDRMTLEYEELHFNKTMYFNAACIACSDEPPECGALPHEYGDFGYFESVEKYPANEELYNSSAFAIDSSMFENMPGVDDNGIDLSSGIFNRLINEYYPGDKHTIDPENAKLAYLNLNLCNQNIRHYRFPDNSVSTFMNELSLSPSAKSTIHPIGVAIDKNVVNSFLDCAVLNGYLTNEQRDSIDGFEIMAGDRTLHKSVIATGIAYDMYKSKDIAGNDFFYANYPYNDLREDIFNYSDSSRTEYITHPFQTGMYGSGNNKFSFFSPDTLFGQPKLGNEMLVEGYQTGFSVGSYQEVEHHPKWIILGSAAYSKAQRLAVLETTAAVAAVAANAMGYMTQTMFGGFTIGYGFSVQAFFTAADIAASASSIVSQHGKRRYDWITIFINNGKMENFAHYYSSYGIYNTFSNEYRQGNRLRGLIRREYLNSGKFSYGHRDEDNGTIRVNNLDKERSVLLTCGGGDNFELKYPASVVGYDSSRFNDVCNSYNDGDDDIPNRNLVTTRIASPYIKVKQYADGQYGRIEDIAWLSTGDYVKLPTDIEKNAIHSFFGGDTYISRLCVKRKIPLFYSTAFGIGDMIPFAYSLYNNIGFPRYYCNFETSEDGYSSSGTLFPNRKSSYSLNCKGGKNYILGKFYLYFYSFPQFLVESPINCNYRLQGTTLDQLFYPNMGDFVYTTQERRMPIAKEEQFIFNRIYDGRTIIEKDIIPSTYDKKHYDCAYQMPNGCIWSKKDVSVIDQSDPWLVYRPLDKYNFDPSGGSLVKMKGIESEMILALFENKAAVYNSIDILKERTTNVYELGGSHSFSQRALEFNSTDLGFGGTQSRNSFISTEFGHFYVDLKRGNVVHVLANGSNIKILDSGLKNWFTSHLPMKLLRYGIVNEDTGSTISEMDIDHPYMGIGVILGWDNKHKRMFMTKKDFIPKKNISLYSFRDKDFYYGGSKVELYDEEYFYNVSYTMAYSFISNSWISYYSFSPNFYIEHQHYFQSGINYSMSDSEIGLWSHLLTNQSYCVFYGNLYPFIIESINKNQFNPKILSSVKYQAEALRYHGEADFSMNRMIGFDKMWLYNNRQNSGLMNLIMEEKNNYDQNIEYPKINADSSDVIVSEVEGVHNINYFFNRVRNDMNNVPIWKADQNDILKNINPDALIFDSSLWNDRLRGDYFLMRLQRDSDSRYRLLFGFSVYKDKLL